MAVWCRWEDSVSVEWLQATDDWLTVECLLTDHPWLPYLGYRALAPHVVTAVVAERVRSKGGAVAVLMVEQDVLCNFLRQG